VLERSINCKSCVETPLPCSAVISVIRFATAGTSAATISSAWAIHAVEHAVHINVPHRTAASAALAKLPVFFIAISLTHTSVFLATDP
jgi:hypothetical protein